MSKNEKRTIKLCMKKKVYDTCEIACDRCRADDTTRTFKVEEHARTCE